MRMKSINALIKLLSFLLFRLRLQIKIYVCQCPSLGFFHFYDDFDNSLEKVLAVSMPFFGLLSFLHAPANSTRVAVAVCQCPSSGFSHFYHTARPFTGYFVRCQCPSSGFFLFYSPLWPPLFIRLPDLISASNSQNILIIHFFRPFFWLVLFKHKKSLNIHHIIHTLISTPSNILYYTLYTFYPQSQPSLSTLLDGILKGAATA